MEIRNNFTFSIQYSNTEIMKILWSQLESGGLILIRLMCIYIYIYIHTLYENVIHISILTNFFRV